MTNQLLASAGLPVPRSEVVRTDDEAAAELRRLEADGVLEPSAGRITLDGVSFRYRPEAPRS